MKCPRPYRILIFSARTVLCLVLAFMVCPDFLSAQPPSSVRITDIQINGLKRLSRDRILNAMKLRVGDVVSTRAINEDIRRINQLGDFDPLNINVQEEPTPGGVRVIITLAELPVVSQVGFAGNRAFDDKKIRSTVGIKDGSPLDQALLGISTTRIEDLYHDHGYQFVEVSRTDTRDESANTLAISFLVKEGPQTRLEKVVFKGNQEISEDRLRKLMATRPPTLFWGGKFDRRTLQMDLDKITQFYKDQGYLDAVVSTELEYSGDKTRLTILVDVVEGVRYRVSDVAIRGAESFTGEALYAGLRLSKGEAFTADRYEKDYRTLVDFYGERGYLNVRVARTERYPEPGEIELVYQVREAQAVRLGKLEIRGNNKTQDKVIRRQFSLFPGDTLNIVELRKSLERLRRLNYFSKVESSFVPGEEPGTEDVVVQVEEAPTSQVVFGAGVSSNAGLIGQVMLNLNNFDITDWPSSTDDLFSGNAFVGGGQSFILQLRPGTESTQASLFFSEPYLFDSAFSFSSDLFYYERDREDWDETRTGIRLGLGHRFSDAFQLRLTARVENVGVGSISDDAPPEVVALDGTSAIRSLILSGDYDRTDNPWLPSRGYRLAGSVEVADDTFGSDFSFAKITGEARAYRTLYTNSDGYKHIFMARGRAGVTDRTHGPDVPFFERFYAGGSDSVRGFAYRGLGPHVNDDPVGGEWMAILNLEYSFPVYGDTVRGVFFADVGTVGRDLDVLNEPVRAGVGVGLQIRPASIGIPIILNFAAPINAQDGDEKEIFSFTIGSLF